MPFVRHRGTGKISTAATFDSMAERWDSTWIEKKSSVEKDFSATEHWKWLKMYLPSSGRVLEAGCGPGHWVYSLNKLGYSAYGVDFARETIERARKRWPHLHLVAGDMRATIFESGDFDGIVSLGAVEHDEKGPEAALREMHRILKPGGFLYCTVPCMNHINAMGLAALQEWVVCNRFIRRITGRNPETQFFEYAYYPEEYENILKAVGFEVIEIAPLRPHDAWRSFTLSRRIIDFLHSRNPFITCHMIAGVCRKPPARSSL
ncbi:MAG: class I SAM-dependent methyltransferase [Nitrospira sp.]|nr:class I SAM-dependent methyltransferase [Nitrospira sp.]